MGDSENDPTFISKNVVGNYDITVPNDAKIMYQKSGIIEGFWWKEFQGIYSKKTFILSKGQTHSFPKIAKLTYV